ncbi:MAG: energy-coupling factor ABC transporter permease [Litorivicinus sp.]
MLLHSLPGDWNAVVIWLANLGMLALIGWAITSTRLHKVSDTQDAIPLGLMGLAQLGFPHLSGGVVEGLTFYPLLVGLSAMMFGFRYSLMLASLTQGLNVAAGLGYPSMIGLSLVVTHLIPSLFILGFLALAQRWWPRNFFVYVWVNGFFGACFGVAFCHLASTLLLMSAGPWTWNYLAQFYLPFGLMMTFPEGFITGAFLTMLVLFKPQWVYTFRDEVYQMSKPD